MYVDGVYGTTHMQSPERDRIVRGGRVGMRSRLLSTLHFLVIFFQATEPPGSVEDSHLLFDWLVTTAMNRIY